MQDSVISNLARSPTPPKKSPLQRARVEQQLRAASVATLSEQYRPQSAQEIKHSKQHVEAEQIVPGLFIKGRLTLLSAKPKCGKTTLVFFAGVNLATGGEIFGEKVKPQVVLFVSLEEAIGDIKAKLKAMDVVDSYGRLYFASTLKHATKSKQEVLTEIIDAVKPTVVIIDTLSALAAGIIADENAAGPWVAFLTPLQELAHRKGISMLLLHHSRKNGTEARGSSAIMAVPDHLVEMTRRKRGENVRELVCEGRYGNKLLLIEFDPVLNTFRAIADDGQEESGTAPEKRVLTDAEIEQAMIELCPNERGNGPTQETFKDLIKAKASRIDMAAKRLVEKRILCRERHGRTLRYARLVAKET